MQRVNIILDPIIQTLYCSISPSILFQKLELINEHGLGLQWLLLLLGELFVVAVSYHQVLTQVNLIHLSAFLIIHSVIMFINNFSIFINDRSVAFLFILNIFSIIMIHSSLEIWRKLNPVTRLKLCRLIIEFILHLRVIIVNRKFVFNH